MSFLSANKPAAPARRAQRLTRVRSLGTRVTESEYQRVLAATDGASPSEWVRALVLARLDRARVEETVLAELWALRYIVINGFAEIATADARAAVATAINTLLKEADQKKADKAKAMLEGTR
jgi:ActR/RegA family two-component response regulator